MTYFAHLLVSDSFFAVHTHATVFLPNPSSRVWSFRRCPHFVNTDATVDSTRASRRYRCNVRVGRGDALWRRLYRCYGGLKRGFTGSGQVWLCGSKLATAKPRCAIRFENSSTFGKCPLFIVLLLFTTGTATYPRESWHIREMTHPFPSVTRATAFFCPFYRRKNLVVKRRTPRDGQNSTERLRILHRTHTFSPSDRHAPFQGGGCACSSAAGKLCVSFPPLEGICASLSPLPLLGNCASISPD